MSEAKVGAATLDYFNGAIRTVTTDSSVLVSSSKYLNHAGLRALVAQEFLRRNGPDLPNTAFIPQVAQILHELEDMPRIIELFEMEKARLPVFRTWLEERKLSNFSLAEVENSKPGTLGAALRDFMVNSGYQLDLFFQEIQVVNDFTFYLRQTSLNHDIEHMVTGFGPNYGGEIALITANMHSRTLYFHPELAAFFNRVQIYLKAKALMKDGLHYPAGAAVHYEAEYRGGQQARNWKYPIMLAPWRDYVDWQIEDIRRDLNITPITPPELWAETDKFVKDPAPAAVVESQPAGLSVAAE
jgi:ubiquinone biosynthesis protein COQ4